MIFDRQAKPALLVVTLTLLVSAFSFHFAVAAANYFLQKYPVDLRQPLDSIRDGLGEWAFTGEDRRLTEEMEEELGTTHYLDRWYVRNESTEPTDRVNVHITYYTGMIDTVPHIPDRCLVASGAVLHSRPVNLDLAIDTSAWEPDPGHVNLRTGEPYMKYEYYRGVVPVEVRMPFGEFRLRTSEYRVADQPDVRIYAGYFFLANGHMMPEPERVRTFAFDLTTRYAYYAKVQFTMYALEDVGTERFAETVSSLLKDLLPEIMRCLPDWAVQESLEASGGAT